MHERWRRGGTERVLEFALALQPPEGSKAKNIKGEIFVKVAIANLELPSWQVSRDIARCIAEM